jgi:hypothetical protein
MSEKPNRNRFYQYNPEALARLREEFTSLTEDEQDDLIIDSNDDESYWVLHLVRANLVEPNVFCSPDWLREFQERYKNIKGTPSLLTELVECLEPLGFEIEPVPAKPESNFASPPFLLEAMENLEKQWNQIDDLSDERHNWREIENDIPNLRNITPVHAFLDAVERGRYPTPEITFAIAKAFELYFTAAGELSLEEVFFGKPKRKSGNFASRSNRELRYLFFHDTVRREMAYAKHSGKKYSIIDQANHFLTYEHMDEDGNIGYFDVDTFLRGYRRWRKSFEEEIGED